MLGKLFVVSAPSGAGKTTLVEAALKDLQKKYPIERVITYTTRPARKGEKDGEHYHFVTVDEFKEKIAQNFFIEWSTWYDYYYGSPKAILNDIKKGTSYIAILDRAGAQDVVTAYPEALLIWIEPASLELLKQRLEKRGKNTPAEIANRLEKAKTEMEQEAQEHLYHHTIKNDDLATAVSDLSLFIEKNIIK